MKERYAFVMMIRDKWWQEFLRVHRKGKQIQSYVQGGWGVPKEASLLFFYVAKPIGEIAGYAEFVERKMGDAQDLWSEHGHESVLGTARKYFDFLNGKEKVSFIRFKNLQDAAKPITLNNLLMLLGAKRISRKGFYIDKKTAEKLKASMG
jgi:predicted transcriptional regulator